MGCKQITIRKAAPSDYPFIFKSWLTSYKHSSKFAKRIPDSIFYKFHHEIVEKILEKAEILVAHLPEDEDVIVGFLVTGTRHLKYTLQPVIHYVYVKDAFRRMGVMSTLLELSAIDMSQAEFTHWTECYCFDCTERFRKMREAHDFGEINWIKIRWPNLVYNPYAI